MGFLGFFFKQYWQIVGPQVIIATQSFFREGWLLKQLNHTFITLIPKGMEHAVSINFALLVSATSICKVISKILVNRLCPLLAKIIDPA